MKQTYSKTALVPAIKGFQDLKGLKSLPVDCVNWPESFPYRPEVTVAAGHNDKSILLRFDVQETNARAVCLEPNGPVWEDSCVEFFVRVPAEKHYYNFETNCIGTSLASRRLSREEFTHLGPEEMDCIKRLPSLPHKVIDLKDAVWSLELEVPFSLLGLKSCPERLEANFYKCGDRTAVPHFLSWSPVRAPQPDFHRPECFGELIFEK